MVGEEFREEILVGSGVNELFRKPPRVAIVLADGRLRFAV